MTGPRSNQVNVVRGRAGPSAGARTGHCPVRRGSRIPHRNRPGGRRGRLGRSDHRRAARRRGFGLGYRAPRWTSAARAWLRSWAAHPARPRGQTRQLNRGRPKAGPGMTTPPERVCSRGRAAAGAQVASRRKAHHGSSRTVFHEGSGQARGTLTHRPGVERECGQCYSSRGSHHRLDASGRGQMRLRQAPSARRDRACPGADPVRGAAVHFMFPGRPGAVPSRAPETSGWPGTPGTVAA